MWDIVDVDYVQRAFAEIVHISYIVRSSMLSVRQKAFRMHRKSVDEQSAGDLEVNVSHSIKKHFAKAIDDATKSVREGRKSARVLGAHLRCFGARFELVSAQGITFTFAVRGDARVSHDTKCTIRKV